MPIILDWLHIKQIEKEIGRRLSVEEIEDLKENMPVFTRAGGGDWMSFAVALYRLPQDLMTLPGMETHPINSDMLGYHLVRPENDCEELYAS